MFVLAAVCSGCVTPGGPFTAYIAETDPFQPDIEHHFSSWIKLKDVKFGASDWGLFNIHYKEAGNAVSVIYIQTQYHCDTWLFAESLKFVVDGQVWDLPSNPSPKREIKSGGDIEEWNTFNVSADFLAAFKNAQSATVRLYGQHYYTERTLSADDIYHIGWFHDYIVGLNQPESEVAS